MGTTNQHRLLFARKFLAHGTRIASVTPSSRWMSRELARHADPARPQRILELGAGTGPVTRALESRLHPGSTLVAVEPDPDFAAALRGTTTRATVFEGRYQDLDDAGPFDVVVSGLPTPSLNPEDRAALFALLAERAPEATFSQLTEIPWVYRPIYARAFREVRFRAVPLNIPPGGVYHCRGVRAGASAAPA